MPVSITINIITMVIPILRMAKDNVMARSFEKELYDSSSNWRFIYGRRKTGKTFFVKEFTEYDDYYFVGKDGSVWDEGLERMDTDTFIALFKRTVGKRRIVIDEFHRLPVSFMDILHQTGRKGALTVLSSTRWLSRDVLGKGSPVLGLFSPVPFGPASSIDVLSYLQSRTGPIEAIEAAPFLREPILIDGYNGNSAAYIPNFMWTSGLLLREMVREVFDEEGRTISDVYDGILEAVASGKQVSGEISSFLFSRGLIKKDSPGQIQSYLKVLFEIGLLHRMEVLGKGRSQYRHVSALFDLFYCLRTKYGLGEQDLPIGFVRQVYKERLPHYVEDLVATFLAEKFGLKRAIHNEPELDIVLMKFKRMEVVGEVKWGRLKEQEAMAVSSRLEEVEASRRLLIVKDKKGLPQRIGSVELMGPRDLIELVLS